MCEHTPKYTIILFLFGGGKEERREETRERGGAETRARTWRWVGGWEGGEDVEGAEGREIHSKYAVHKKLNKK